MSDKTIPLTNDLLKGIMTDATVVRGYFTNIDETMAPGIYFGSAEQVSGTLPDFAHRNTWTYGTLEVIKGRSPRIIQRLTSDSCDVAVRTWLDGWRPWKALTS